MAGNEPLVSVNISTYNRSELLENCLKSVMQQSYQNLEIIVVDDASKDNTQEVVEDLHLKDRRIKLVRHEKNKGNAYARNTALANGTGKYVAFMDDDDEWIDRDKITNQVNILESNQSVGIVCSNVRISNPDEKTYVKRITVPGNIVAHILRQNGIIFTSTAMTRRSIIEAASGFDTRLFRGVDSDFYRHCIVVQGYKVHFMEDVTALYRELGADSITILSSKESIRKLLASHSITIHKYFRYFITHPGALLKRLAKILKYSLRYIGS